MVAVSPFPNRAYGRPGTAVLPSTWAAEHGLVADGFRTAVVSVRPPGGTPGGFDDETGTTTTTPFDPFIANAPAVIAPLGADQSSSPGIEVAGDVVKVTAYRVSLSRVQAGVDDDELAEGALVDVVTCDDPQLEGRTLNVTDVVRGSDLMTRDLICTVND